MNLSEPETGLLEHCFEDWRGLWEIAWAYTSNDIQAAISLVHPVVGNGYLTIIAVSDWHQAQTAVPMEKLEALQVVRDKTSNLPPTKKGDVSTFYQLLLKVKLPSLLVHSQHPTIDPALLPGVRPKAVC